MSNEKDFIVDQNVLLDYLGSEKHVEVPNGITKIEPCFPISSNPSVFCKNKKIESIVLPVSLEVLEPTQFYYLSNLRWIECKGEVAINSKSAFPGCKKLTYVICNPNTPLSKMPEKWRQLLAVGVTKYIADGNTIADKARAEVSKYFKSQNKKLKLYQIGYEYPFVAKFMTDEEILSEKQYDEMIDYAQKKKLVELLAILIAGRHKQYPSETAIDRAEKDIEKEINHVQKLEDHSSLTYLKTQWTWKRREDGSLIMWTYKGTEPEVTIPAFVGKNKVTAIRGHIFESREMQRNNWLRSNLRVIRIEEGVIEIGGGGIDDGRLASFDLPMDIYLPRSVTRICSYAFKSEKLNLETMERELCFKNVTIHAPSGSYAEEYAKKNNIPFKEM